MNDQFKGDNSWERYLCALETATPPIRAIGITDYYSCDTYKKVLAAKIEGRLPNCNLIFPNVEMRLDIGTVKGKWVNIHLLTRPDEEDHLTELERFLARLTFSAFDDSYACTPGDLTRLGYCYDSSITNSGVALAKGTEQFKIGFEQLKSVYKASVWAEENILIAVTGSETDGTSGVRESADATLREEIEKFAHIILASSPAQREFWLGQRNLTADQIRERYGALKPCLHGSDAHSHDSVALPNCERYSWIKGEPTFDTLRQACIDPAGRAYVGVHPPTNATPSQVIKSVLIHDAPWVETPDIELNPGLVAIIGARGSGKTALADIIARGCNATSDRLNPASFLTRAKDLLADSSITLEWQHGEQNKCSLSESNADSWGDIPRARYLSQQFVEELCAADGMTDALIREIERVIFDSHPLADRDGAVDFEELLEFRATRSRGARMREESNLADLSERIAVELENHRLLPAVKKQMAEKEKAIRGYELDRKKLVTKGSEERVTRLSELNVAAEKVRGYIRSLATREQTLLLLQDEVKSFRNQQAAEGLRSLKERFRAANLKEEDWTAFKLDFAGDTENILKENLEVARENKARWKGTPLEVTDPKKPLLAEDADLNRQDLAHLESEILRIEQLVGADRATSARYSALSKRIDSEKTSRDRLQERLTECEAAMDRVRQLQSEREKAYVRVFQAIVEEQSILITLYAPLMQKLEVARDTLKKLSFSVRREADIKTWADTGQQLWDLRLQGPFKGRGTLEQLAQGALKEPWEHGDPSRIGEAMARFLYDNYEALMDRAPVSKADQQEYRQWSTRLAKWLFGTDHINIRYSIDYDGTDIRKLSPGTRGIVLLLLYLALDDVDDRPLIIDQPEENLDPKSIFDELVGLFVEAKKKRQVIMVTHNANLVVNADADQVIVATAGPHKQGELPPISYDSGGLESAAIRKAVCDILEGGERAFQERSRRLRVKLER